MSCPYSILQCPFIAKNQNLPVNPFSNNNNNKSSYREILKKYRKVGIIQQIQDFFSKNKIYCFQIFTAEPTDFKL